MNFLRIETKVPKDRKIVLDKLPFKPGESVEIIVLERIPEKPIKTTKAGNGLKKLLKSWMKKSQGRSVEEINIQIAEERNSWD